MQKILLAFVSFLILTSVSTYAGQANAARPSITNEHAIIQRRRVVLVRSVELAKNASYKKRAVVVYPGVSGLSAPVLRRVRAVFDFKNIFDYSLKEYREDTWLDEFSYKVNYNGNYLLDVTFSQSGSAAYPDDQTKHFLINLRDGSVVKAADVFEAHKITQVVAVVDRQLQREIKDRKEEEKDPADKEAVDDTYKDLKFQLKDLDDFSVGPKGITFLYDAGFPHVIRALEPAGRYFFSYSVLKPFIKRDGPLGQFVQ